MEHKRLNILGIVAVLAAVVFTIYITRGKNMDAGIKIENMDLSVKPGNDFYDYATHGWAIKNPIPDDYTRYGAFDVLRNTNLERVREIAENDTGKIGKLYQIAMNADKLNADKTTPVAPYIAEIDELKSPADLPAYLGKMHMFSSAFWGDSVGLDEMDSEHYIYNIGQGGIGMARDYYFDTDEKSVKARTEYKKFITKQMENFSIPVDVTKLYDLEERMAKSFYPKEKLRDPHANYHKMSIDDVRKNFPDFDWDTYLLARGASAATNININQPEAIAESIAIMNDTDFALIKTYLKYRVVSAADGLLDDTTYDITFDFYNRFLAGQLEQKPRWKRAVAMLDGSLGEEIGHLYVKKYFSSAAKSRMEKLVKNLQRALGMRIEKLSIVSSEGSE